MRGHRTVVKELPGGVRLICIVKEVQDKAARDIAATRLTPEQRAEQRREMMRQIDEDNGLRQGRAAKRRQRERIERLRRGEG